MLEVSLLLEATLVESSVELFTMLVSSFVESSLVESSLVQSTDFVSRLLLTAELLFRLSAIVEMRLLMLLAMEGGNGGHQGGDEDGEGDEALHFEIGVKKVDELIEKRNNEFERKTQGE